jgi:hypothetical protein
MMAVPFAVIEDFPDIVPNTPDDLSQPFQNALNGLGTGDILYVRKGKYRISQISLPRGVELRGVGIAPNATVFEQIASFSGSAIVNDPSIPTSEWQHWGGVKHLRLTKEAGWDPLTVTGHGIYMDRMIGEDFMMEHLLISGFPQSGIRCAQGGTPAWIKHIHVFGNGEYGIDMYKPGNRVLQNCHLDHISADNNKLAVIRIGGMGDKSENVHISHVKAESFIPGNQTDIILLDGINNIGVTVEHVGGNTSADSRNPPAGVKKLNAIVSIVRGTGGRVHMHNTYIGGYPYALYRNHAGTYWINMADAERGQSVVYPAAIHEVLD